MKIRGMFFALPFLLSTAVYAGGESETFSFFCKAGIEGSDQSLIAEGELGISQRPTKGTAIVFDYEIFGQKLRQIAKVEIDFGATVNDDAWTMSFIDKPSSSAFAIKKASMADVDNTLAIISETPDGASTLTLECRVLRQP